MDEPIEGPTKSKQLNIRIPPDVRAALDQLAQDSGRRSGVSGLVRQALQYLFEEAGYLDLSWNRPAVLYRKRSLRAQARKRRSKDANKLDSIAL